MRARRWPTRCSAAPPTRRSSRPVASRCTSLASRPTRCRRYRCPSRRQAPRPWSAPRRCNSSSSGPGGSGPTSALTAARAPVVAQLCIHLDGIPLALELAAARIRSLSIEQINARLHDRFQLLTSGSRTALPRQQTLRATARLELRLLARRRAHRPAAAGGVRRGMDACRGGSSWVRAVKSTKRTVLDLLTRSGREDRWSSSRQKVHVTDCWKRYGNMPRKGWVRARAARRFGTGIAIIPGIGRRGGAETDGVEQAAWLQRLEEEHENLRAALDWSLVEAGSGRGLRFCGALQRFWWMRGHLSEGRESCRKVLGNGRR